jgi:cardiolipin synthase A/B
LEKEFEKCIIAKKICQARNILYPSIYSVLNKIKLIQGSKPYFDTLINLIQDATATIHLQTYIFDEDETGQLIANSLINASKRNVQVYLFVDGYASQSL